MVPGCHTSHIYALILLVAARQAASVVAATASDDRRVPTACTTQEWLQRRGHANNCLGRAVHCIQLAVQGHNRAPACCCMAGQYRSQC
jgi:hypothetical protein